MSTSRATKRKHVHEGWTNKKEEREALRYGSKGGDLFRYWQRQLWLSACDPLNYRNWEEDHNMCPIYTSAGSGKAFENAPEGFHQAVCVDVVDRGIQPTQYGPKHKVDVIWEVVPQNDDGTELRDTEGKRFRVLQRYNNSIHEKALLGQHLKAWRGQAFTPEEREKFDLEKLIGANCQIQVVHNPGSEGRTFANVQAIVKANPKHTKLRPSEDYVRVQDRVQRDHAATAAVPAEDPDADIPF